MHIIMVVKHVPNIFFRGFGWPWLSIYTTLYGFFCYSSSGWGKIKRKRTTLPRIFMHVVCHFHSFAFAIHRYFLAGVSSPPVVATGRAVPSGDPRY